MGHGGTKLAGRANDEAARNEKYLDGWGEKAEGNKLFSKHRVRSSTAKTAE